MKELLGRCGEGWRCGKCRWYMNGVCFALPPETWIKKIAPRELFFGWTSELMADGRYLVSKRPTVPSDLLACKLFEWKDRCETRDCTTCRWWNAKEGCLNKVPPEERMCDGWEEAP